MSNEIRLLSRCLVITLICLGIFQAGEATGAGILTPKGSVDQPIRIQDHHVNVTLNNGFAVTEVTQTFYNPNNKDLEAIYSFPLPVSASLSEVTLYLGENEINGEVLPKDRARRIYEEERDQGNETGLAEKNEYQTFEFYVHPVRALDQVRIRFLYYQPLEIDLGMGRYLYPLQEGGTDEAAQNFWTTQDEVDGFFSIDVELKSNWPVAKVRAPGYESVMAVEQKGPGHFLARVEQQKTSLSRDFVFYYRLADDLPGRVELIPFRADESLPGTFMMVVTPGMDLQPLRDGADYTFVLDVSGSMKGKIATLAHGVVQALEKMKPHDRFRIITFNKQATNLTSGWISATPAEVAHAARIIGELQAHSGTNLYAGIKLALKGLDDDRANSVILVTDGVTNTGIVDPESFQQLLEKVDIRIFGFLLGNSANWPLMRVVCEASGGFYTGVSNQDDLVGQILLAKSKIVYECLHDAKLDIDGVKISDATDGWIGKIYRGEQLVIFGRYAQGGEATVTLKGRLTGEDKTYSTVFDFPSIAPDHPEIERLWALDRIECLEYLSDSGRLPEEEARQAVEDLGVQYQLVTNETSMVVLSDAAFEARNIDRLNGTRTAAEREARARRANQPVTPEPPGNGYRRDHNRPMFPKNAPSPGRGGAGAIDPMALALIAAALLFVRRAAATGSGDTRERS